MPSPVDTIGILRVHLEEIYDALNSSYTYQGAEDLRVAARNVGGTSRPSNLTKRLEKALGRVEGYLNPPEAEDVIPEE